MDWSVIDHVIGVCVCITYIYIYIYNIFNSFISKNKLFLSEEIGNRLEYDLL